MYGIDQDFKSQSRRNTRQIRFSSHLHNGLGVWISDCLEPGSILMHAAAVWSFILFVQRREPVPPFGGWRLEDPSSPVIDYTEMFTKARASRLGSLPQDDYQDDYYSQPDEPQHYASNTRTMVMCLSLSSSLLDRFGFSNSLIYSFC